MSETERVLNVVQDALSFAKEAHGDQKRKYTGEPYWHHLVTVATLVARVGGTPEMLQAALLHDTLEDTSVSFAELQEQFGATVAEYVLLLTDPPHSFGNRAARKAEVVRRFRDIAPPQVKTIKLADLIDNTGSIVERDPSFAALYMAEKRELLEALRGGDESLFEVAQKQVNAYFAKG